MNLNLNGEHPAIPALQGGVPACRQALDLAWYRAGRKGV
jgi:hypothetical protein